MKNIINSSAVKRILWTLLFILVYILGSKLALPFVAPGERLSFGSATTSLEFANSLMGGSLRQMSFLSVGLSPWMSSMLLWRMFTISKNSNLNRLPFAILERRKMYLTLGIAFVQSLAIALYLPVQDLYRTPMTTILHTILLIAGSFFLVWLSDLNAVLGVGGPTVIMMTGMIMYMPYDIYQSFVDLNLDWTWALGMGIFSLFFLYIGIVMELAKYRIPVNKVGIHNQFQNYSYLDIKLNPAGGMPVMYAMTLVMIPQYVLLVFAAFNPQDTWAQEWIGNLAMGQFYWYLLYLFVLVLLTLAFSFVNVSGDDISEKMMKNAEYIDGVYPGRSTKTYINSIVLKFAVIGTIYILALSGLPMATILIDINFLRLSMVPGLFLILIAMVFQVKEEIKALRLNEQYRKIF